MKKLFLTLLLIGAIFTNIDAQNNIKKNENSFIKDRISFNIGGGYNSRPSYYEYDRIVMSFEGLYGFNNWLEAGAYFSYLTESFVNTYYCTTIIFLIMTSSIQNIMYFINIFL